MTTEQSLRLLEVSIELTATNKKLLELAGEMEGKEVSLLVNAAEKIIGGVEKINQTCKAA